ncbi:hypothetical protein MD484_g8439, partial [Candolleomyces efflorescens]
MTIETTNATVSDLKKVKNSVIGNPLAKDGIVRNEELMRRLIESIADSANETHEEVKVEAAHIVASLSYGSEIALSALLKLNTPYAFVFALSKLFPEGSTTLRAAYARALRALVSSIADVVGPSEYGLRPETPASLRLDTKEALDGMFSLDTLDVILPLLLSPSPQVQTPVVQLIASATRSSVHRIILVSWLPPDERRKEQGKAKKRGWEKLSASSLSGSPVSPGASPTSASWIVKVLVMLLARTKNTDAKLQEAVLLAMAALSKENASVAVALGRGVGLGPDVHGVAPLALILSYTKSRNVDVQLAACLCPPSTSSGSTTNSTPTKRSIATSTANTGVVAGGVVGRGRRIDYTPGVRTNIVDSGLGMEVFRIVVRGSKPPSSSKEQVSEIDEDEREGEAVCNIVMEFSPLRPIYLEHGLMPRLVQLLLRSGDGAIRMNAIWAIKNLLYKSSTETKRDVMRELGWTRLFDLLHDPDLGIQEQAYHVVRNLSESDEGIEMVFRELGVDAILDSITESISVEENGVMVLTTPVSPTSPSTSASASAIPSSSGASSSPSYSHPLQDRTPTILQALSALANLCNGPHQYTAQILAKPQLLTNLKTCLAECGASEEEEGVCGCGCCWDVEEVVRVGSSTDGDASSSPPPASSYPYAACVFHAAFAYAGSSSYIPDNEYGDGFGVRSVVGDGACVELGWERTRDLPRTWDTSVP